MSNQALPNEIALPSSELSDTGATILQITAPQKTTSGACNPDCGPESCSPATDCNPEYSGGDCSPCTPN